MNAEGKKRGKTEDYYAMASASAALAEAATLDHVREKHEVAAAKWRDLAILSEVKTMPPVVALAEAER